MWGDFKGLLFPVRELTEIFNMHACPTNPGFKAPYLLSGSYGDVGDLCLFFAQVQEVRLCCCAFLLGGLTPPGPSYPVIVRDE